MVHKNIIVDIFTLSEGPLEGRDNPMNNFL